MEKSKRISKRVSDEVNNHLVQLYTNGLFVDDDTETTLNQFLALPKTFNQSLFIRDAIFDAMDRYNLKHRKELTLYELGRYFVQCCPGDRIIVKVKGENGLTTYCGVLGRTNEFMGESCFICETNGLDKNDRIIIDHRTLMSVTGSDGYTRTLKSESQ